MRETSATPGPAPTLLIVDDQAINVRAMHSAFAPDHRVLMATGGVDALRICRESLPDLILLDVVMPDLGGHEVCRQLKADPRTCDIPIIFVTAQDEPSQEMLGLQMGAVDFIGKPVNPAVMRARVRTHLELRRTARHLALLNESLELRIADRTRDLEAALKAAALANRIKSEFLSNISHEILTPINGVVGMAYLALRADPGPTLRGYLDNISVCGQHLLELVEDILDFSSLASNEVALEHIEFELSDVMSGVASQTLAAAGAKGLALSFDVDPTLAGLFVGDPLRIGRCCSTTSPTRPSSAPRAAFGSSRPDCPAARISTRSGWRCGTMAWACTKPMPPGCSRPSTRWTDRSRGDSAATGWVWRHAGKSPR